MMDQDTKGRLEDFPVSLTTSRHPYSYWLGRMDQAKHDAKVYQDTEIRQVLDISMDMSRAYRQWENSLRKLEGKLDGRDDVFRTLTDKAKSILCQLESKIHERRTLDSLEVIKRDSCVPSYPQGSKHSSRKPSLAASQSAGSYSSRSMSTTVSEAAEKTCEDLQSLSHMLETNPKKRLIILDLLNCPVELKTLYMKMANSPGWKTLARRTCVAKRDRVWMGLYWPSF